jgi:type II secretory pathway pseudopilin PulG
MRVSRLRRPAHRLVEVLVAVAVVAIAVGLFLPAVPRSRHLAGARTQCINNLKQIGLAVHNYASASQNSLPALTSDMAKPQYGAYNGGILVTLLPYLEQEILFNNGALALPSSTWYGPVPPATVLPFGTLPPRSNAEPLSALPMKVYQCPADATLFNGHSGNQTSTSTVTAPYYFPWAGSSYAANYQVFGTENDFGAPTSGNFCGPEYKINNVPDGTSNTVFFGEQFAACGTTAGNLWAYPGVGNYFGSQYTTAPGAHAPVGSGDSIVNEPGATNSYLWTPVFANSSPAYGFTAGEPGGSIFKYNARGLDRPRLAEPYAFEQYWDAPPQTGITQSQCDKSRLQSFHTAAVLVCMGDGSVRVVNANVSQATWYAAIMPADGDPLGSDW